MSTRREMGMALLGLPLVAGAVLAEVQTNGPAELTGSRSPEPKPGTKRIPPPYSVEAANIISYTLYAEARGEPEEGMLAVASVIKTRSIRSKKTLAEVCLQNQQFSCWNNINTVPDFFITGEGIQPDDLMARGQCFVIAWIMLASKKKWAYLTHFYNPNKSTPDWAYELRGTRTIGNHVFGYID